jgi:hypothetical protein
MTSTETHFILFCFVGVSTKKGKRVDYLSALFISSNGLVEHEGSTMLSSDPTVASALQLGGRW